VCMCVCVCVWCVCWFLGRIVWSWAVLAPPVLCLSQRAAVRFGCRPAAYTMCAVLTPPPLRIVHCGILRRKRQRLRIGDCRLQSSSDGEHTVRPGHHHAVTVSISRAKSSRLLPLALAIAQPTACICVGSVSGLLCPRFVLGRGICVGSMCDGNALTRSNAHSLQHSHRLR
jgi:hypothetical protein